MKISVVTAVCNRVETARDALGSVAAQTYRDLGPVVPDAGSTDAALAAIAACAGPAVVPESGPDGGIRDVIDKAIARPRGDAAGPVHFGAFFASDRAPGAVAQAFSKAGAAGGHGGRDRVFAGNPQRLLRHGRSGSFDPKRPKHGWRPPAPMPYLPAGMPEVAGGMRGAVKAAALWGVVGPGAAKTTGPCSAMM
ncbi:hypothetical protein [Acidimangrovimonas pyrenivorans]|uniref:Uncharacterized protein n=1 Tax=Acidimangrovimonas pyrenivorans TaxID=2030798 RepID=A0ABV7AMC8_9RHOB